MSNDEETNQRFLIIVHCEHGERIEGIVSANNKAHAIVKMLRREVFADRNIYNVHVYISTRDEE